MSVTSARPPEAVEPRRFDYYLPRGYQSRALAHYFDDAPATAVVYQPEVYALAAQLWQVGQLRRVIDIGCGGCHAIASLVPGEQIVGVDHGRNLSLARARLPAARFIEADLESGLHLDPELLADAVVICSDVAEHLVDPEPLLRSLAAMARVAPFVLIPTPDRTRARGIGNMGPPGNPAHVREWSADEWAMLTHACGLSTQLLGHTISSSANGAKNTLLSVCGRHAAYVATPATRVLAVVSTFNDVDFLGATLSHLATQEVAVHVLDDHSTDGTFEMAQQVHQQAPGFVVAVQRTGAPGSDYLWADILARKAAVGAASGYDWIMHYDSDELRVPPWPGVTLGQACAFVDACGYTAIDHTVLNFRPTEDGFGAGDSVDAHFRFCEFGRRPGHFTQVKAWKNTGQVVDLASSGGHRASFAGARVYPLKFLLKHYPLRSCEQAERKVYQERLPRFGKERAERGWHTQYDAYASDAPLTFTWRPSELLPFMPQAFASEYLVERLSGVGVLRP